MEEKKSNVLPKLKANLSDLIPNHYLPPTAAPYVYVWGGPTF